MGRGPCGPGELYSRVGSGFRSVGWGVPPPTGRPAPRITAWAGLGWVSFAKLCCGTLTTLYGRTVVPSGTSA